MLFASWSAWAKANGEAVGSRKDFVKSIIAQGCVKDRKNVMRGFKGLRITLDEADDGWPGEPPSAYRNRRG